MGSRVLARCNRACLVAGFAVAAVTGGCNRAVDYGGVDISVSPLSRTLRGAKLQERSYAAVVTIETNVGRGMGFVVDPAGYIVTNRHVIEDADYLQGVLFPNVDPGRMYESVRVVYSDPVWDLALLHVKADGPLPHLPLATQRPVPVGRYLAAADPVVVLEQGGSKRVNPGLVVRRGKVAELAAYNPAAGPGAFVGVTTDVVSGQSGGPVLDAQGRAVGVVTWTWRDRVGGYAIPIAEAARMLRERPQMKSDGDHRHRAESRARTFFGAVARGDNEAARRLTSPSHARDVRTDALSALTGGKEQFDPETLSWFVDALEGLAKVDPDNDAEVTESFRQMQSLVESTGSPAMRQALGLETEAESGQVVAFFHEFGSAYLASRMFGKMEPEQALQSASERLRTVDAARTFALALSSDSLRGREVLMESIDIVPGAYKPTAVVRVIASAEGKPLQRLSLHLRLEWGDWYVAEIRQAALSEHG